MDEIRFNTESEIIGHSLQHLKDLVIRFADEQRNILFIGESGTGKELFAKLYGPVLQQTPLHGQAGEIAIQIGLLSPAYEAVALDEQTVQADPFLFAVARGAPQEVRVTGPMALAIQAAFQDTPPPTDLQNLLDQGQLGEALLRAIILFDTGFDGDPQAITSALSLMRAVGLEDVARRTSLQLLLLERARGIENLVLFPARRRNPLWRIEWSQRILRS